MIASLGEAELERAIASVLQSAQTGAVDCELVVVWQAVGAPPYLPREVEIIRTLPLGISWARNVGLARSAAPLIAYVDDDEVVESGWARGVISALHSDPPAGGVFGPIVPLDDEGFAHCNFDGAAARFHAGPRVPPWVVGSGGNMAFARSTLLAAGAFDLMFGAGSAGEDSELIVRLLERGERLRWSPEMVVAHPTKSEAERLASRGPYAFGLGRLIRRHRSVRLAASYTKSLFGASLDAAREGRRRRREVAASWRGFIAGALNGPGSQSPEHILAWMPAGVRSVVGDRPIRPLDQPPRPDPHLMYTVDHEWLLHVFAMPSSRLKQATAEREAIANATLLPAIPRLRAAGFAAGALWTVEDRMRGSTPKRQEPARWFERGAGLADALGAVIGPKLAGTPTWQRRRSQLRKTCPPDLLPAVETAANQIEELPSRPVHGDFERKNLLFGECTEALVDWETATLHGPPGLDLLFLCATTETDSPSARMLLRLASGIEPPFGNVLPRLGRQGVTGELVPAAILVALAIWAADERDRFAVVGVQQPEPLFHHLLAEVGGAVAAAHHP